MNHALLLCDIESRSIIWQTDGQTDRQTDTAQSLRPGTVAWNRGNSDAPAGACYTMMMTKKKVKYDDFVNRFTCVSLVNGHAWVQQSTAHVHYVCTNTHRGMSVMLLPSCIKDMLE